MKPIFEPIQHLARSDKHFIGAGEGLLHAPPFPVHGEAPGFWDTMHYHLYPISPGFTYTVLDGEGRPIRLLRKRHEWTPGRTRITYQSQGGVNVTEKRAAGEWDSLVARVSVRNLSPRPLRARIVLWTALPVDAAHPVSGIAERDGRITLTLRSGGKSPADLGWALGMKPGPASCAVQLAEAQPAGENANRPDWDVTPFSERMRRGRGLGGGIHASGVTPHGLLYIGLEREILAECGSAVVADLAVALGGGAAEAEEHLRRTLASEDPIHEADRRWRAFLDEVPWLECSDDHLLTAYWYRWYGLRLNSFSRPFRAYRHPAVCEGIEYFRSPISYSAPCHMREMRWHPSGRHAKGSILNFIEHQLPDGSFPGHIHPDGPVSGTFYHADWGGALLEVLSVHEDAGFLEAAHGALSRYARHFERDRDPESTGMYDIFSQYETGQEYMSRYVAVRPEEASVEAGWDRTFRLKGVDATVYAYRLYQCLDETARLLGRMDESERWRGAAARTAGAVRERMWSSALGMFQDLRADTLEPTGILAATCLYPYFTDIPGAEHAAGFARVLLDPAKFWTPFPVPSSALTDPLFDAEGLWQGKRHNCPWNGRVWPMVESHVAEALFTRAAAEPSLAPHAAHFLHRFVRMLFRDGDAAYPGCFEHYNPFTGQASYHRGIDDYMHSWVADLILKYAAGLQPRMEGLTFDPRPLGIEWLRVTNAVVRGRSCDVEIEGGNAVLRSDGKVLETRKVGP